MSQSAPDADEGAGADRRSWLPIGIAGGLLAVVLGTIALAGGGEPAVECATDVEATSPLLGPDRFGEDERLETLASSVGAMTTPFGDVVAGVGYDYDQWLRLYGVGDGLLSFTKDNAPVTLLDDEDLEPRWALRPKTKRIAWDATENRFVLLNLAGKGPIRVGSFAQDTGEQEWCVALSAKHEDGDPVSTAFLDDGDLLVALPTDAGLSVTRLSGKDGRVVWSKSYDDIGRADFLAQVDEDSFVVGGVEAFRLAEGTVDPDSAQVWMGTLEDGELRSGMNLTGANHVLGVSGSTIVLLSGEAQGTRLIAKELAGPTLWSSTGYFPTPPDVTLRGDMVIVRTKHLLAGYDATTGEARWRRLVPQESTYFPYGFTLSQMPSLDETHVLMPTTTSLEVLDITTGESATHALPTDGVSTTYWPYQLAVTPDAIAVVTNTGGVVAERD